MYRQRATKAEQENAKLRAELAKRPDYEWFVELIRRHLKQDATVPLQHLAVQVKQLKNARGHLIEQSSSET
ncbi:hypothetical protein CPT_Merlin286 [Citrobacter phage Merlin]|uniref:Uncharacterized protein n=1 Tax=Citrobacter phage Merlin TaxID=1675602 RepID=A0A0K1LN43_9CAUD|nr:hypothetical protein CPT_Merlin286 [Citrobacter phage Merlin]AKU43932.1 hypothetical protein CPT_Merlin286 [Citrobacter phage Merlin]